MSGLSTGLLGEDAGWLTFEVFDVFYALPTDSVLEVTKADRVDVVPGIGMDVAQVINWKGEPLPLIAMESLLGSRSGSRLIDEGRSGKSEESMNRPILIVTDAGKSSIRIGFSVDRVLGLVPLISPGDGDVQSLHPGRLLAQAGKRIESAVTRERWAIA